MSKFKARRLESRDHGSQMIRLGSRDGDAFACNGSSNKEGTCLDAVGNNRMIGSMEFLHSLDLDALGAGTGDPGPHGDEEIGQIDDFGLLSGSLDHRCSLCEDRCHHDIAGSKDGRSVAASEIDSGALKLLCLKQDISSLDSNCGTKGLEALQVKVNRPITDDASTG